MSHFTPTVSGNGGNHRAYQVAEDLAAAVGRERLTVLKARHPEVELASQPASLVARVRNSLRWRSLALRRWRDQASQNPLRLLRPTGFDLHRYRSRGLLREYADRVSALERPLVCVIEHPGLADIVEINRRSGIPTVATFQNIESLDLASEPRRARLFTLASVVDFANEYQLLARCQERMFLSRVEAGLVGGMGLKAVWYPYRPVGELRASLMRIRAARSRESVEKGLLLVLGSANHLSTRRSMEGLLSQAARGGLPGDARLVMVGKDTEAIAGACASPNVRGVGWLPQNDLDSLLARAQAVLVPQDHGMGAVTRIPDMACAGIPTLCSYHATLALDAPPSVIPCSDDWGEWRSGIERSLREPAQTQVDDYEQWERRLPKPLASALERLATG